MKILIVEDDFVSRIVLQKMLEAYGKCDIAVNGKEAIEAFKFSMQLQEPYDLICLDIMMPEMDGKAALKEIRKLESENAITPDREVKIIMVTALDTPRDVIQSYYEGGCSAYIVKPINKKKLYSTVKDLGLVE